MKADRLDIVFHPVTANDLPTLAEWIGQPHWQQWWGEPKAEVGMIRDMVEGRDTTRPFLFHIDGEPRGYIQYWHIGDHQTPKYADDNPWLSELAPETIGIDLSIADANQLSKGIGSAVLRRFAQQLAEEGYRKIIIDPDRDNARAIRAYSKAGFTPVPALEGRSGEVVIMQFDANETDKADKAA